jgi:hypothetical protein
VFLGYLFKLHNFNIFRLLRRMVSLLAKKISIKKDRALTADFEALESSKLRHGRMSHLPTLEDKLLCILMYYRTYISHVFSGYLFNLHNSNICRLLAKNGTTLS